MNVSESALREAAAIYNDGYQSSLTIAEAFFEDAANPTEPNSAERIERIDSRAARVRKDLANMSPHDYEQWEEDYYAGLMVPPFGFDNGEGFDLYNLAPHGLSIHGMPKLRPEDD